MNPECTLIQERLPALLGADLPDGEAALVNAHLSGCPACAAERDATAGFLARLRLASEDPAEFVAARNRLAAAIDAATERRGLARVPMALRVAAVLALCAGALWSLPPGSIGSRDLTHATDSALTAMRACLPDAAIPPFHIGASGADR